MPLSVCQLFHSPADHPSWYNHMLDRFFISDSGCVFWRKKVLLQKMLARVVLQESPWKGKISQSHYFPIIFSVLPLKKTFTAIWVLLISTPHPSIEFYYPLWWLLTFDGQGSHSSPQSVIKGISNCTKCYLLGSGTLYIVITCTFVVAFPMFWSLYFKLEDRFHRGQSGIFHCGLCRTLMKQRFNK